MDKDYLLKQAMQNKRSAQKELYESYSPIAYAVIRRYIKDEYDAEDVLIETFMKVFENLGAFKNEGSFEGWIKKIAIRESLMFLRRNKALNMFIEADNINISDKITVEDFLGLDDLLKLLDQLPAGYRIVFNLYVIEGYKHNEIAELLGISINTSKSQLRLAKDRLRKLIEEQEKINTA
jgi:RNA polymerase sigma-70 factor (ECF subfamily)